MAVLPDEPPDVPAIDASSERAVLDVAERFVDLCLGFLITMPQFLKELDDFRREGLPRDIGAEE